MKSLRWPAKIYIFTMIAVGMTVLASAFRFWESPDPVRFGSLLLLTLLAAGLKVSLPGITGTMSVSHVFILLGVVELKPAETVLISCAAVLAQTYWHAKKRPAIIQALFNVSSIAIATAAACRLYQLGHSGATGFYAELLLGASACVYFFANTLSVAGVVSLTERKSLPQIGGNATSGHFRITCWELPSPRSSAVRTGTSVGK